VTRHGLDHASAAATPLRPMAHLVPDVVTCDPMFPFYHHSSTRNRRTVAQYRNEATRQARRDDGRIVPRVGQKSNSP
jgi:hypothetical protein